MEVKVLTSAGRQLPAPLPGAGAPTRPVPHPAASEDETEDGQSIGLLIEYGKFRFVTLADLTWNSLHRLFCPSDRIGEVDAYVPAITP